MDIRRTQRQTVFVCVTALISGGLAWWNLDEGRRTDSAALLVLGGVFAVWTLYLVLDLVRRDVPVRIGADGVSIRHVLRSVHIPFDQMTWTRIGGGRRAGLIAYRPPGAEQDQCVAFAQRTIGPEGVEALRAAIAAARPGLPDRQPGAGSDKEHG